MYLEVYTLSLVVMFKGKIAREMTSHCFLSAAVPELGTTGGIHVWKPYAQHRYIRRGSLLFPTKGAGTSVRLLHYVRGEDPKSNLGITV